MRSLESLHVPQRARRACALTGALLIAAVAITGCKHASSANEAEVGGQGSAAPAQAQEEPLAASPQGAPAADATPPPAPLSLPASLVVDDLDDAEKALLRSILSDQFDPCGKSRSFLDSLAAGDCALAPRLARSAVLAIGQGFGKRRVVTLLLREIERLNTVVEVDTGGAPARGPADAKVVVVLFSDFECPYCKDTAAPLDALQEHYGFRLVYKHYPLERAHPSAKGAARAAWAAGRQERFWEMHDVLFHNSPALDWPAVKGYAKGVGLDMKRFVADFESEASTLAVAADVAAGGKAGVDGTPTFFINGRRAETLSQVQDAVREQAELAGVTDLPPPFSASPDGTLDVPTAGE